MRASCRSRSQALPGTNRADHDAPRNQPRRFRSTIGLPKRWARMGVTGSNRRPPRVKAGLHERSRHPVTRMVNGFAAFPSHSSRAPDRVQFGAIPVDSGTGNGFVPKRFRPHMIRRGSAEAGVAVAVSLDERGYSLWAGAVGIGIPWLRAGSVSCEARQGDRLFGIPGFDESAVPDASSAPRTTGMTRSAHKGAESRVSHERSLRSKRRKPRSRGSWRSFIRLWGVLEPSRFLSWVR